jgi:hypothetical protein
VLKGGSTHVRTMMRALTADAQVLSDNGIVPTPPHAQAVANPTHFPNACLPTPTPSMATTRETTIEDVTSDTTSAKIHSSTQTSESSSPHPPTQVAVVSRAGAGTPLPSLLTTMSIGMLLLCTRCIQ